MKVLILNFLIYISSLLGHNVFGQTFESPDSKLIKKLKIPIVTSWLCNYTDCSDKEIYIQWTYDKNGNLVKESLLDDSDTFYIDLYSYDSMNRLIRLEEIGDFLCHEISESNNNSVMTDYLYDSQGLLIETSKSGGCCLLKTKFYYDEKRLLMKVFQNSGCKYQGELDTTFYTYNVRGKLISEKNRRGKDIIIYEYDDSGQLIKLAKGKLGNESNYYHVSTFSYKNRKINSEIQTTYYGFKANPAPEKRKYIYSYNKKGTVAKITEFKDERFTRSIIYTYK